MIEKTNIEVLLTKLFTSWIKGEVLDVIPLGTSGSPRRYFRIYGHDKTAIGVYSSIEKENKAFISFSKHFLKNNLPVPKIYKEDLNNCIYLIEDLGDDTLFQQLPLDEYESLPEETLNYYLQAIEFLPYFQINAGKGINYKLCYPRQFFDRQSMHWDLNYFKYYFIKLHNLDFDEQLLEDDFLKLMNHLSKAPSGYFMYRDFQSRNIMIKNNKTYFIDYQGGRKGPLQYDIVSLLFQVKAQIPSETRDLLMLEYLRSLRKSGYTDELTFYKFLPDTIFLRLMQVMGAYGYRGIIERKSHFIESIPYAIKSLKEIMKQYKFTEDLPMLNHIFKQISSMENKNAETNNSMHITINSFAYKNGIPEDNSEHGGGFVFDCRSLPNPGREEKLKSFTGKDHEIEQYFADKVPMHKFLASVNDILDLAITNYIERDFNNLMINFGCTGGQHRSVYCAERIAQHINLKHPVSVSINHREL